MSAPVSPTGQLISNPIDWKSPLRPSGKSRGKGKEAAVKDYSLGDIDYFPPKILRVKSLARQSLFQDSKGKGEKDSGAPTTTSISSHYTYDFRAPSMGTNGTDFFEIRELVLQIETLIYEKKPENRVIETVRARITCILKNPRTFTEKMGELGMILFYLDINQQERPFPASTERSLVAFRAHEIENEVHSLVEKHEAACPNIRIPSGKTHYLLRAFAHMAMTSGQEYNKGGLHALIAILESNQFHVTNDLRAEHHDHILIVTKQILANQAFIGLFRRDIEVHPNLQDAIRIDLKLNPNDPVHTPHVFWDCFMFLFSDIRQAHRNNCYAIGSLIYATENAPYKTVEMLVQLLEQGHYIFNNRISIPLPPLLEKRLVYAKDLHLQLPTQDALSLTTFQHISSTMSSSKSSSGSTEKDQLRSCLKMILNADDENTQLPYTERLYHAYKYNTLSHLLLGVMEFSNLNSPELSLTYSKTKEEFLDLILSGIEHSTIRQKLGEKLWFENCSETDVELTPEGVIKIGSKEIRGFKGDRPNLVHVFKNSMRLFYLESGEYILIDSFADLQKAICGVVDEIEPDGKKAASIKGSILDNQFDISIARHAAHLIDEKGIMGYDLRDSDLLVFKQLGGNPHKVLRHVFGFEGITHLVNGSGTPNDFMRRLWPVLRNLDRNFVRSTPRFLAFTPGHHIWTISPKKMHRLFDSKLKFTDFVQIHVFGPADTLMRSPIPKEVLDAVIERYAYDNVAKQTWKERFERISSLTYEKVHAEFMRSDAPHCAKNIIDDEFGKIPKSNLDLKKIFSELQIRMEVAQLDLISEALNEAPVLLSPFLLAQQLRKLLIQHHIRVVDTYDLECAICHAHDLPIAFDLGDLNWDEGVYREDPPHSHLVIRYSWGKKNIKFYHRESKQEYITDNEEFEYFNLHLPAVAPSPHPFW